MPQNLDENDSTLNSSDEVNQDVDVNLASGDQADGTSANASDAQDVAEDRGAIDVVEDVVKARQPEEGSSPEAEKEGEKADPKAEQEKQDREIDNDPNLPEKTRKRIQKLLGAEKAAKREAETYKGDAERYQNLTSHLQRHGVPAQEASDALMVACLARTDPVKAWALAKPFIQQLLVAAGEVLPPELKTRVESGELTVEAAQEIAKANAGRVSLEKQREIDQQQLEESRHAALTKSLKDTANAWQADREAKDPKFEAKKLAILKELKWLQSTEEEARTPEQVRDQLERAYKAVNAAFAPARTQIAAPTVGDATRKPIRTTSTSSTKSQANEPTGALKFIQRQISNRGAAA